MSTLREIVYSILDVVKPNNLTSSSMTEELVKQYIKVVRAQLIKQSLSKNTSLHPSYIQSLGCVTLTKADKSECCDYPVGCKILRTSVQIPSVIDGATSLLTRVGPVNISEKTYQNVQFERVPFIGTNRYSKNIIKWFYMNNTNYVYLITDESYMSMGLEVINIQGIFEDPEEVGNFRNCSTGTSCFTEDSKYPIPDSILPILKELVIKKFMVIEASQPIDKTNDNNENSKPQI
jgi:hypothetical protein